MFSRRLQDIEQLKARIRPEVRSITRGILRGVINSCRKRLQPYTANSDAHLMDKMFKN
jgi:hypothetical protein